MKMANKFSRPFNTWRKNRRPVAGATFGGTVEKDSLHDEILRLNVRAAQFFARQLSRRGQDAPRLSAERAVTEDIVRQFRMGYAPMLAPLADDRRRRFVPEMAEQAGLVIAGRGGATGFVAA